MKQIEIKSYAKINLCLNILKRLPNNYHEISSLMQRVDLYDKISVKKNEKIINIKTDDDILNEEINKNTAYLASKYFFDCTKIEGGADIFINKNIPHTAGLGGSSSNAAAVINALDLLYDTNLTYSKKFELGLKVGCDVPFFFGNGTAIVGGMGDKIIQKKELNKYYVLIIKPEFGICTKKAYASLNPLKLKNNYHAEFLYTAYVENNKEEIKKYTINTFEDFIEQKTHIISIKKDLLENGALISLMTGSGSSVFGIFSTDDKCAESYYKLKNTYKNIYKCEFI